MEVSGQLYAPVALPPGKNPSAHRITRRVGVRIALNGYGEQKIPYPYQASNTENSSTYRVAIPTTLFQTYGRIRCRRSYISEITAGNCPSSASHPYSLRTTSLTTTGYVSNIIQTEIIMQKHEKVP
jgi:hypothetical protein